MIGMIVSKLSFPWNCGVDVQEGQSLAILIYCARFLSYFETKEGWKIIKKMDKHLIKCG